MERILDNHDLSRSMKCIKIFQVYIKENVFNQAELKYTVTWMGLQALVVLHKCNCAQRN